MTAVVVGLISGLDCFTILNLNLIIGDPHREWRSLAKLLGVLVYGDPYIAN
jgi:hypothetical protein